MQERSNPVVWDARHLTGVSIRDVDTLVHVVMHDGYDQSSMTAEFTVEQAKALRNRLNRAIKYARARREYSAGRTGH